MKLYMSPASPFARKVRVIARELDLMGGIEEIAVNPATSDELHRINPLRKIPVLVLDDGSTLIDSKVICEYLDDLGRGKFFPGSSVWHGVSGRWRALTLQAIGDGISEAAVARVYESRRADGEKSHAAIDKYFGQIMRSLDALERMKFAVTPTVGEIATACALGYLDFREVVPGWRDARPQLRGWYETFCEFPSMQATTPANLT